MNKSGRTFKLLKDRGMVGLQIYIDLTLETSRQTQVGEV